MVCKTLKPLEFRGKEEQTFTSDNNENVSMTVYRFDDENGVQNSFYVVDTSKVLGLDTLARGKFYDLTFNVGRNNKLKLSGVILSK